jgi:hypothetical protein
MQDQTTRLLEVATAQTDGGLECPIRNARAAGAQLVGILQNGLVSVTATTLVIPPDIVEELTAVWAFIPEIDPARFELDRKRKTIGNRAEAYSYQLERSSSDTPSEIVWVARDDDTLGYDIEDRTTDPRRRIEVKGSGGSAVRFFLTAKEYTEAQAHGRNYEVHFWGEIDLNRSEPDEYRSLRSLGYPRIFLDIAQLIASGVAVATPDRWNVTVAASLPPGDEIASVSGLGVD